MKNYIDLDDNRVDFLTSEEKRRLRSLGIDTLGDIYARHLCKTDIGSILRSPEYVDTVMRKIGEILPKEVAGEIEESFDTPPPGTGALKPKQ